MEHLGPKNIHRALPSLSRLGWNAPPRAPALSGRQLELAWNVLVARRAAAAVSSPSSRSELRQTAPAEEDGRNGGAAIVRPLVSAIRDAVRIHRLAFVKRKLLRIKETSALETIRPIESRRPGGRVHAGNFSRRLSIPSPLALPGSTHNRIAYICIQMYIYLTLLARERATLPNSSRVLA